jgi:hypothetical protein
VAKQDEHSWRHGFAWRTPLLVTAELSQNLLPSEEIAFWKGDATGVSLSYDAGPRQQRLFVERFAPGVALTREPSFKLSVLRGYDGLASLSHTKGTISTWEELCFVLLFERIVNADCWWGRAEQPHTFVIKFKRDTNKDNLAGAREWARQVGQYAYQKCLTRTRSAALQPLRGDLDGEQVRGSVVVEDDDDDDDDVDVVGTVDKAPTDKTPTDKAPADKVSTDKAPTDKVSTDKAPTDKAAPVVSSPPPPPLQLPVQQTSGEASYEPDDIFDGMFNCDDVGMLQVMPLSFMPSTASFISGFTVIQPVDKRVDKPASKPVVRVRDVCVLFCAELLCVCAAAELFNAALAGAARRVCACCRSGSVNAARDGKARP